MVIYSLDFRHDGTIYIARGSNELISLKPTIAEVVEKRDGQTKERNLIEQFDAVLKVKENGATKESKLKCERNLMQLESVGG